MKPTRTFALLLASGCLCLSAAASDPEPAKVSGTDVPPPALRKRVEPVYPEAAQREGISGIVILELTIDENGVVVAAETVRSIPELDQAAIAAAKQWRFAVTRVNGRPVRVLHTVPLSFTFRVPELRRQRGIPELRRGLPPTVPSLPSAPPAASAVAEITLAPDGTVAEVTLREGQRPWSDALLAALRTWRFAPGDPSVTVSFRVEAVFQRTGNAALSLTGLRQASAAPSPSVAPQEPSPSASPAAAESTVPQPPTHASPAAGQTRAAPSPSPNDASPVVQAASDVIDVQPPPEPTPAPAPSVAGTSAVAGVSLGLGVPDLLSGRRPVVPPLARIRNVSGTVVVGFAVDSTGHTSVQQTEGPEALREQASQAVRSWTFRQRLPVARLFLTATFDYTADAASAHVQTRN